MLCDLAADLTKATLVEQPEIERPLSDVFGGLFSHGGHSWAQFAVPGAND
jgi:hypothetical protein